MYYNSICTKRYDRICFSMFLLLLLLLFLPNFPPSYRHQICPPPPPIRIASSAPWSSTTTTPFLNHDCLFALVCTFKYAASSSAIPQIQADCTPYYLTDEDNPPKILGPSLF
ncbi:uncharacterized protein BO97DRAFT_70371 [Aspergillus homomorphus CBS 101889]|uniref:Uncharacterized protein n=1 Tax=Aspergillus homomorphus (strain CBS 101889) TaxID=1450537 RepID=A0A395HVY6_ASPHC|nr:hypothetical protein BO97DRAFT_70371 [Aspergillus homomorphus CBS 101889]RAL12082.1 hypothetical protein BO97DRAFT_70371 [Aspergillus homomorphus CBS 101889]